MVFSWTPCDWSDTSSLDGKRVALMRARRSARSGSGVLTLNGTISPSPSAVVVAAVLRWKRSEARSVCACARRGRPTGMAASAIAAPRRNRRLLVDILMCSRSGIDTHSFHLAELLATGPWVELQGLLGRSSIHSTGGEEGRPEVSAVGASRGRCIDAVTSPKLNGGGCARDR